MKCSRNGRFDLVRTIATQIPIDFLQAPDEIQNFFSWNQTACRFAKMRPTTERPVRVDYTTPRLRLEQRTSEIGLRIALGADRGSVLVLVLRGAFRQVGIGLALGIPAAID